MVITEETYNDLSARIDAGEFLGKYHTNAKDETPELPPLPAAAPEDLKTYRDKCQHILDFYEQKIKAKEAQIETMRLAIESSKAQSQAYDETVKLNSMLENENAQLKHENLKLTEETWELDVDKDELQRKNNELEDENTELKVMLTMNLVPCPTEESLLYEAFKKFIGTGIEYACDIHQVKDDEKAHTLADLLAHMLDSTEDCINDSDGEEIRARILRITKERYIRRLNEENNRAQMGSTINYNYGNIGVQANHVDKLSK